MRSSQATRLVGQTFSLPRFAQHAIRLTVSRSQVVLGNARVREAVLRGPQSGTFQAIPFPSATWERETTSRGFSGESVESTSR